MKLRYTARAAQQIDEALDYIAEHITSRPGVRRLTALPYPYLIDYRVTDDEIIVLRFRHSAQKSI